MKKCDKCYTGNWLGLAFFLLCHTGYSQSWKLGHEVKLSETITSVSIDANEQFYVGLASGSMIRYAVSGEEDQYFSLVNNAALTTIESWNRLKVYCFFRDQQRLELFDRFTTTPRSVDLAPLQLPMIWLLAPGVDNSFWILTNGLRELKKYDDQNQNLILNIPLLNESGLENPVFMRAYKNEIILVDPGKGLFFFDQFGNSLKTLEVPGATYFQILNNQLITLARNEIWWIDPFTFEVLKKEKAPAAAGAFRFVVISGDAFVFFTENGFQIYSLE